MGSFINTFEGSDDIQDNNSAADRTLIDMIEEISLEINLSFVKVRISEVKME